MKKFLPKTLHNPQGFTLVELLVVIAIIAILSVIGFGIFSGTQGAARDGRRRVEIDQLAKNIESTRDASGTYLYTDALGAADYPSGLPDPGSYVYCHAAAATFGALPGDPANWQSITCPGSYASIGGASFTVTTITGLTNDLKDAGVKAYKVCASSERTASPICKTNIIR